MENQIFGDINTFLDLNGPVLEFTTQPSDISGDEGDTLELVGIATVTFPGDSSALDKGTIKYQWYESVSGTSIVLDDSGDYTGTATTTLSLANLTTPLDKNYYLEAEYAPTYQSGIGYSTGNAANEPLYSNTVSVKLNPKIEISSQPESFQTEFNVNQTFTVDTKLTDMAYTNDITYQWIVDGVDVSDGVLETTTETDSTTAGLVNYSFRSNGSHNIPSVATDVKLAVAGAGGGAGGNGGAGGSGMGAKFDFPDGARNLEFVIGSNGNGGLSLGKSSGGGLGGIVVGGTGSGGVGGNSGSSSISGAGGGGGGCTYVENNDNIIIVAGGGGGAGGDSGSITGGTSNTWETFTSNVFTGNNGSSAGGGGGGGCVAGSGGVSGGGAVAGGSCYNDAESTVEDIWENSSLGYVSLQYVGYTDNQITKVRKTTISGATTNTLTINADHIAIKTIQCRISSVISTNSPVLTNQVNYVTLDPIAKSSLNIEQIGITNTAGLQKINLKNGDYTFDLSVNEGSDTSSVYYSFYCPTNTLNVEMDLYGGKGENGGEGGYSRIRFAMLENTEYVIAGLTPDMQAPFLYRKGELMASVGGGGDGSGGGSGGGINVSGENGGGSGGPVISPGELSVDGIFGGLYSDSVNVQLHAGDSIVEDIRNGGRATKCSKGEYWADQGKGACDDLGNVKFRLGDGTEVTNTSDAITRGFKAGYPIIVTAGKGAANGGNGGNGVTGGQGGQSNGSGGGGGSGYEDRSLTSIEATQLGGSTGNAKVVLRLAVGESVAVPVIPEIQLTNIPTTFSSQAGTGGRSFNISAEDIAYMNFDTPITFTYQWQYSTNGNDWIDIDDATGSTLTRYETVYYSDNGDQIRCVVVGTNITGSSTVISNTCTLEIGRIWAAPSFVLSGPSPERSNAAGSNTDIIATNVSSSNVSGITYTYQWQYSPYSGASFSNIPDNEGGNASTVTRYNPCYYSDNGNQIKCKVTGTNSTTNPIYYDSRDGSGEEYSTTVDSATCSITVTRNKSCPSGWSEEIINKKIGNSGTHSQHDKYNVVGQYQLPTDICAVKVYFHPMYGYGRCNSCNGNHLNNGKNLGWKMKMVSGVYYKNDSGEWTPGLTTEISQRSDTYTDNDGDEVGKCDEGSKKSYDFYDDATGDGWGSTWNKTDGNGNPVTPYVFVAIIGSFKDTNTECKECWPWSCDDSLRNKWQWIGPVTKKAHNHGNGWYANIYYKVYTYHYESRP